MKVQRTSSTMINDTTASAGGALPAIRPRDWLAALMLPASLALLFAIAQRSGLRQWTQDREALESSLAAWGIAAPLLFVLCYSFLPLVFIPRGLLALLGGYIFGWPSVAYTWVGALIGETAAYFLAAMFGRALLQKAVQRSTRARSVIEWLRLEGFWAVLMLRLFPFMPTDVVNFGSGLSGVRYRDFAAGTSLGILPGCIVFSYYGQLFEGDAIQLFYAIPLFVAPMFLAIAIARLRYGNMSVPEKSSRPLDVQAEESAVSE